MIKTTTVGRQPSRSRPLFHRSSLGNVIAPAWASMMSRGAITQELVTIKQRELIAELILQQAETGIDVPSEGEFNRKNYWYDFVSALAGIEDNRFDATNPEIGGHVRASAIRPPTLTEPIRAVEDWRYAQSLTEKPVKITLPGPIKCSHETFDRRYFASQEELSAAYVPVLNQAVRALEAAGCRYIQIDDCHMTYMPDQALAWGINHIRRCFEGTGPGVNKVVHLCRGTPGFISEYHGWGKAADPDCYSDLIAALDAAGIDWISIEDAFLPSDRQIFRQLKHSGLILGSVDVARLEVDSVKGIVQRCHSVLEHLPPERLMLAPDCGFTHWNTMIWRGHAEYYDTAIRKLSHMVKAASILNAELSSSRFAPKTFVEEDDEALQDPLADNGFALQMTERVELSGGKNLLWFNSQAATDSSHAHFLILTSGSAGALWLTGALNRHPDIFTSCGRRHPIEGQLLGDLQKDGEALLHQSHPDHYRFGNDPDIMRRRLRETGMNFPVARRDNARLPWFMFDELESLRTIHPYKALGNARAFTATEFSTYFSKDRRVLGDRRIVTCNLLRHPVTRTEAFLQFFQDYQLEEWANAIDAYIDANADEIRTLEKTHDISMEDPRARSVLFVYRVGHSVKWVADELRRFSSMKALRFETLRADPDYFANAVALLTSNRVVADRSYLDQVFSPEGLATGRRSNKSPAELMLEPRRQWEAWSDWERHEFAACCHQHQIPDIYKYHDYDLSFVR